MFSIYDHDYIMMSYMCFQYSIEYLNVIDVITPNLGNYRTDMMIHPKLLTKALNQLYIGHYI